MIDLASLAYPPGEQSTAVRLPDAN